MARSLLSTTTRVGDINPVAGSIYDAGSYQDTTSMKIGSVGAQVRTIQVTGSAAAAGDIFTTTIGSGGTDVVATLTLITATAATDTAAATALANNLNTTTGISNVLIATSSTDTVTLTGRQKGASETFTAAASTDGSGGFTVAGAVAPTDATAVQFGTMCERSTATRLTGSTYIGAAVGTGTYTAQVSTITAEGGDITLATGDVLYATVTGDLDGTGVKDYSAQAVYRTNAGTTLTAFVASLNGALPANSVLAAVSTNDVTFTAEIAGLGFTVAASYDDAGGTPGSFTVAATTPNACPIGGGVALKALCVEQNSSEVAQWSIGDIFSGLTEGKVYVRLDDSLAVAVDDPAFVRVTAVSPEEVGAFRNAADGTDCLPLSAYGFEGKFTTANSTDMDGNNVAALYLRRTV